MARFRLLMLGLASGSALYSGMTPALGLGEINLHSALNQPLDAEIELFQIGDLSEEEIKVRLASAEEFSRAGVERFYFLNDLRFTPVLSGGRGRIRVRSNKPVREPYLNFIVEVARPGGNLLREYTVLIDPPGSSAYTPQAAPLPKPAAALWQRDQTRPLPQATQGERYRVKRGDSLWSIAGQLQASGASAERSALMSDIHALNPQAFSNGDPNRLRADVELLLPDSANSVTARVAPAVAEPVNAPVAAAIEPAQQTSMAPQVEPAPEQMTPEQAPVTQPEVAQANTELAAVTAQNQQLQDSLTELQEQLRQLQAQMAEKDLQMQQIRGQLAEQVAPVKPVVPAAPNTAVETRELGWGMWFSGAAVLLLLAGVLAWVRRTQPKPEPEPLRPKAPESRMVSRPVTAPVAATVAAPVAVAKPAPVAAPQPAAQFAPQTALDPLEGANIYIAYGRFADAASSLRKAIEQQPERLDLRLRLLEVCGELGDAAAFFEQERQLRDMGASHVQVDQIRARYENLRKDQDQLMPLAEEAQAEPATLLHDDFQLNLDDLSLDTDWGLSSPFEPEQSARAKAAGKAQVDPDFRSNLNELPEVSEMHIDDELLESFADLPQEQVLLDAPIDALVPERSGQPVLASVHSFEQLAGNRDHLVLLNTALAYIEQGNISEACDILNELISNGDEQQRARARELLARIA